jgi:hypothetical protein
MSRQNGNGDPPNGEPYNMSPTEQIVTAQLSQDGQMWRSQLTFTAKTVQSVLQQAEAAAESRARSSSLQPARGASLQLQRTNAQKRAFRTHSLASAGGVVVVVVAFLAVFLVRNTHSSSPTTGIAPPPPFHWTPVQHSATLTAQEAFSEGVTLTPCNGNPPLSQQVTWMATNAQFGLAIIQAICPDRQWLILFGMAKDASQIWNPAPQYFDGRSGPVSGHDAGVVPSWLALPAGPYFYTPAWGAGKLPITVDTWFTASQIYLTGQLNAQVAIPSQAVRMQVDGHSGWMVQAMGLVSYLVPLAPNATFLFVSTASSQAAQPLAAAALTHLPELLGPQYQ